MVTCALKSPNRTCGCEVPASSCPEYSMTTSPPGSAAFGKTFLMEISLILRIEPVSAPREHTIPRQHRQQLLRGRPSIAPDTGLERVSRYRTTERGRSPE